MFSNVGSALSSIWSNKVRSVLTVLGVIIGVTSVTILVSLGEGLKEDMAKSIQGFGTNVITIVSGKLDPGNSQNVNPANFISGDIITLDDVHGLETLPDIQYVTPISVVPGSLKYNDIIAAPTIMGTYPNMLDATEIISLKDGTMFSSIDSGNVIVLANNTKQQLFGDSSALGRKVMIGKEELEVIGVLNKSKTVGVFNTEFDAISLIPFNTAKKLNKDQVKIMRVIVKARDEAIIKTVKNNIHETILARHDNEENFTVLTQEDLLGLFDKFLTLATTMISAIAAISLIVGGIGIMNIMLVTVTERTHEIGLRKAVGATKFAILVQFLTEAIMVTLVGALLGLLISFGAGWIIAAKTELQPVITSNIILIAVGISVIEGIIFGLWPALRAANKDPIQALRYE